MTSSSNCYSCHEHNFGRATMSLLNAKRTPHIICVSRNCTKTNPSEKIKVMSQLNAVLIR